MSTASSKAPPKPPSEIVKKDLKKEGTPVKEEKPRDKSDSENRDRNADRHDDRHEQHGRRDRDRDRQGDRGDRYRRGGRGGQGRGGFHRGQGRDQGQYQQQGGFGQQGGFQGGYGQQGYQQEESSMFMVDDTPKEPKKFTGRCRLFVGNITPDTTEEQFKEMFTPYGEVSEVFVNAAKGFGFIRLDYRLNAEKAKMELDGQMRNNRVLRVRFATHGAALKVTNLSPFVSNELLEHAFSQFGEVERAVVIVDDRGRSNGEGIVEFSRKPGASAAMKRISDGVFLMSSSPRPVNVEMMEQKDEEDGLTEKFVQRNEGFRMDREKEPRFAQPGSFEFEFGMKHRRIDQMEKEGIERVKSEMEIERKRLAEEMETAMFDYQAEQIRQDLMRQQEELKRLEEMKNEQIRRRQEMDMRRQEERMKLVDNDRRRQQEMMMRMGMGRDGPMSRDGQMGGQMGMRDGGGPGGQGMPGPNREEMMRGQQQQPQQQMSPVSRGNRSGGPGTPPMPPPPVPPGMNQEQNRQQQGGALESRFGGPGGPADSPTMADRPPADMQRQGQFEGQGGQFRRQGGNFPNQGMGNMMGGQGGNQNNMYGNMGNNPNMAGTDRRQDRRSEEQFGDMKRMRRY